MMPFLTYKKCVPSKHFLHGLTLKSTVAQFTTHTYARVELWNEITNKIYVRIALEQFSPNVARKIESVIEQLNFLNLKNLGDKK